VKVARPVLRGPRRSNALGLPDQAFHKMSAVFDDPNLIGSASLVPVMRLAHRAGLPDLLEQRLSVPSGERGGQGGLRGRRDARRSGQYR